MFYVGNINKCGLKILISGKQREDPSGVLGFLDRNIDVNLFLIDVSL